MSIINFYENIPKSFMNDDYYNPNASKLVPLHPFRMLIVGSSGSGKTNLAINLIYECNNFQKIYLYANSLDQPLYKFLIEKMTKVGEKLGTELIVYSNNIKDIPDSTTFDSSIQNLIIVDDAILEKSLDKVTSVFVKGRHNNCSIMFLSQSFFAIPKMIRLNANYILLRGIDSIRTFNMIAKDYTMAQTPKEIYGLYKRATSTKMSFLMIDLSSTDPRLKYRCNYKPISVHDSIVPEKTKSIIVKSVPTEITRRKK